MAEGGGLWLLRGKFRLGYGEGGHEFTGVKEQRDEEVNRRAVEGEWGFSSTQTGYARRVRGFRFIHFFELDQSAVWVKQY